MVDSDRPFTVGRAESNDVVLSDPTVSNNHAEFNVAQNNSIFVSDRNSSNGTYLLVDGKEKKLVAQWVTPDGILKFGEAKVAVRELLDAVSSLASPEFGNDIQNVNHGYTPESDSPKRVSCVLAFVFASIYLPILLIYDLMELDGTWLESERDGFSLVFFLPSIVLLEIFECILLYKCWKALPGAYRKTSPGRAVGFLFIPVYNFYWYFCTYKWLAEGFFELGQDRNHRDIKDLSGLAISFAVLSLFSWTALFFLESQPPPLLTIALLLSYVADFIIFIVLFKQLAAYANWSISLRRQEY